MKIERQKNSNENGNGTIYASVEALADDLGLSRGKAYAALRAGEIPSIRIGKRFIIPRAAIAEWLKTAGGKVAV
jgi:excisionase family DNA binding protein